MQPEHHVAVDLGAGSGRVIIGSFGRDRFTHEVVHRFPNSMDRIDGHERWNTAELFREIQRGLERIDGRIVRSIGVDTWAVDYGLFDEGGELIEEPIAYRDHRTDGVMDRVFERVSRDEIYALTGIQFLSLNTIFQLFAQRASGEWPASAARFLMMPDVFHYFLSGEMRGEFTNATTTQLVNAASGTWERSLFERLDLDLGVMPALVPAGTILGELTPALQATLEDPPVSIVAPAAHDTASAVVATPLDEDWVYLSSGTWSLLGIETREPITSETAARFNFTNEGGAFGTNRFLKNLMGLWLLESCRREWEAEGTSIPYDALMQQIRSIASPGSRIDVTDERFLNPPAMLGAIADYFDETGQPVVTDQLALSRCILESLAHGYASVVGEIETVTGRRVKGVRIVGGGCQNDFLNQATADATGLPVEAGPVEATSIGNLAVQAIATGRFADIDEARDYIRRHVASKSFDPGTDKSRVD